MANFYLLSCAVLTVIVFSQSVDSAVVPEFDEQIQQFQPYNELTGEIDDVIDEPKDDGIDEPEEYGLQFLSDEPEQRPGLDWWNHHIHYHHDDYHYDYHHGHHAGSCTCQDKKCSCCVHDHHFNIYIDGRKFILSACVNVTYLHAPDEFEISVTQNNRIVLTERTVDLKHSPKLCYKTGIRRMKKACVEFHDVSSGHACVKLTGEMSNRHFKTSVDLHLGCFTIRESEIEE